MKKVVACALAFALLSVCTLAVAGPYKPPKHWDDLSWWGKSGATPAPFKDATVNAYWWWPTTPVANAGDAELWGNRGKVLHNLIVAQDVTPPVPPSTSVPPTTEIIIPPFNNVLFDYNKSFLRPEGKQEVDKVVQWMKDKPGSVTVVEGHASAEGTDAYNMALGQRRANAVRDYMIQSGIDANRVTAISKGESEPAMPNDSEPNRKLNRRTVFRITLK